MTIVETLMLRRAEQQMTRAYKREPEKAKRKDIRYCTTPGCGNKARGLYCYVCKRKGLLAVGLQKNGRPVGHGGGCRCEECRKVEGP